MCIGILMKLIGDRLEKIINQHLKAMDLTLSQAHVLRCIGDRQGLVTSLKEIQDRMKVTLPTMVGLVNRLEAKGLVTSVQDANDRRMKNVFLTPKAEALMVSMDYARERQEKAMTQGLSRENIRELRQLLAIVYQNIGGELDMFPRTEMEFVNIILHGSPKPSMEAPPQAASL